MILAIIMTEEERHSYNTCREYELCKVSFSSIYLKVADHNHLSGKFRQTQEPKFVPYFLQNLFNYEVRFIVTVLDVAKAFDRVWHLDIF